MICTTPDCTNQRERLGFNKAYRKTCSSCRKRRAGRPIGGWQLDAMHREEVKRRGVCEDCGLAELFPGMFDCHHVDGNPRNNDLENLRFLCPSCHRIADWELKRA
jgi:hypothetical protein